MTQTNNLKLNKWESTDLFDYTKLNENADIVDANVSNPNLLDNPWFTVNQRGQSSYSELDRYTVDRWYNGSNVQISVLNDCVQLGADAIFKQRLEKLENGTYTLSVSVDGEIIHKTIEFDGTSKNYEVGNIQIGLVIDGMLPAVRLKNLSSNSIVLKCVKLERGSVSTLANDSAPNYATELLKCQRYCIVMSGLYVSEGYSTANTLVQQPVSFPRMRTTPSATFELQMISRATGATVMVCGSSSILLKITPTEAWYPIALFKTITLSADL